MKAREIEDKFTLLVIFENSYKLHLPKSSCDFERSLQYHSVNPQLYSHSDDFLDGRGVDVHRLILIGKEGWKTKIKMSKMSIVV